MKTIDVTRDPRAAWKGGEYTPGESPAQLPTQVVELASSGDELAELKARITRLENAVFGRVGDGAGNHKNGS